uniref:Ribonuclease Z n=1 Tax=Dicranema revolutum TaxID=239144 RepID=A0A4D6WX88_9FLOR|nr:ribonuclease Z [Dicranema revolutum]
MEIINLNRQHPSIIYSTNSFVLSFQELKDIWLFNCCQGCQHKMEKTHLKISQISKIFITELNIHNISGLLGLLSSLSLINRRKIMHIYATRGLEKYLELGKRYSQTNFRYHLYFHTLSTGFIMNSNNYHVYNFSSNLKCEFLLISREKYGKFQLQKAKKFNLATGPLYGKLKNDYSFLLPDGSILQGYNFTNQNNPGNKISIIMQKYHTRNSKEISYESKILAKTLVI